MKSAAEQPLFPLTVIFADGERQSQPGGLAHSQSNGLAQENGGSGSSLSEATDAKVRAVEVLLLPGRRTSYSKEIPGSNSGALAILQADS